MVQERYKACIEACYSCASACDHCATACLAEPDPAAMEACIRLDIDCAEMCRLSAGYMARDSDHAGRLCAVCAEICDACGAECEKFEHAHCKECAQACRRCAEECRRMAV